jgi:lipopolysaccharide transport system ATP-binding protein
LALEHAKIEILESFDPSLKPTSTIEYESLGVRIEEASVFTLSGLQVNNLVSTRTYRYSYKARFFGAASTVRFGMLIKTTSGFELGGSSSAPPGMGEPFIAAGTVVQISFLFRCSLLPGVYYLNAGCSGWLDEEDRFLHRLVDTAMFRVLPQERDARTGIVDFEFEPTVEVITSPES